MKKVLVAACFFSWLPNLPAQTPPSYAKQVRPFLAKYCLECHNGKALKGGLSLETYKAILEGSDKGAVLSAGKPDDSALVTSVEGRTKPTMPPKAAKFHPKVEEITVLRAWISAGAKDDSALIKVAIPDIKPRKATAAPVASVAYDSTGVLLAVGKLKSLALVNLHGGIVTEHAQPASVTALAFAPAKHWLAAAVGNPGEAGSVVLLGVDGAPPSRREFANLHKDTILDVAISPDGKSLASAGYDMQIILTPLVPDLYDKTFPRVLKDHSDAVYSVAFSSDGKQLASCSADRAVKVWDAETGKLVYTLGDATDWLYTVAWSPDGKHLAAGGADKSIRVYRTEAGGAKIVHSVFAHEAAIQKVVYSKDGRTLYSLGQDRIVKAWDAERMVERKVYDKLPETGLCLAVREGEIAVGRYDGVVQLIDAASGKTTWEIGKAKMARTGAAASEPPPGDSPGTGRAIKLPAVVEGTLDRAGAIHFYRFEASKGQQLGVKIDTKDLTSKVSPYLQLTDRHGSILTDDNASFLGYTFAEAGTYALGIRDQEYRGGADMRYRVHLGEIPVAGSLFPLGLQRGTEADIGVRGVFLDGDTVHVKAPATAAPGDMIAVPVASRYGKPLGQLNLVVGEFPEVADSSAMVLPVPGTANGRLHKAGQQDAWKFSAKKGQRLIVETSAQRLGSPLDSVLDILDVKGNPVPRAVLRCQAKTYVTFRDHDDMSPNIRIETWGELGVNDMLYVGGELMKIKELPTHPDADCSFFFGPRRRRLGYLDTTPTHHAMNEPMYKVTVYPPGRTFPPNGYPVFTLYYRNDDGGPGYGRDSRIFFDAPADGEYLVRVGDAAGRGGANFSYRLTVRPPRPNFKIRFDPTAVAVPRGGAVRIQITAERLDGYDGPIDVRFDNLPPGFSAPPTTIEAGQTGTDLALYADAEAKTPAQAQPLRLIGEALIDGQRIRKDATGDSPKTIDPGDIVTTAEQSEVTIEPGRQAKLTVTIERRQGFKGRVPLDVRGLPHGVRVIDIGLNGILVNENETRRTVVFYAEPWVEALSHPLVISARREGKNTDHAAKAVILKVAK